MDSISEFVVLPWYRQETRSVLVTDDADPLPIDPTLFLTWCSEHDLLPNADARIDYAREIFASRTRA